MKLKACLLTVALAIASLTGCAALQSNASAIAAVSASVEFVTGKYIQGAGAAAQQTARAVKIKAIAADIATAAASSSAPTPTNVNALLAQIDAAVASKNYDPATLALVNGLVQALAPELQSLESTPAGGTAAATVAQVAGWVELACTWYGA